MTGQLRARSDACFEFHVERRPSRRPLGYPEASSRGVRDLRGWTLSAPARGPQVLGSRGSETFGLVGPRRAAPRGAKKAEEGQTTSSRPIRPQGEALKGVPRGTSTLGSVQAIPPRRSRPERRQRALSPPTRLEPGPNAASIQAIVRCPADLPSSRFTWNMDSRPRGNETVGTPTWALAFRLNSWQRTRLLGGAAATNTWRASNKTSARLPAATCSASLRARDSPLWETWGKQRASRFP